MQSQPNSAVPLPTSHALQTPLQMQPHQFQQVAPRPMSLPSPQHQQQINPMQQPVQQQQLPQQQPSGMMPQLHPPHNQQMQFCNPPHFNPLIKTETQQSSSSTGPIKAGGKGQVNKRISTSDIQLVQNLIERCLQLYMSQHEVVETLQNQAKVEPEFTKLVWKKLEEQNPDFFRMYYTRLKLKDQIVMFNHLLEQQVQMMKQLQLSFMQSPFMQRLPQMLTRPGMPPFPMPPMPPTAMPSSAPLPPPSMPLQQPPTMPMMMPPNMLQPTAIPPPPMPSMPTSIPTAPVPQPQPQPPPPHSAPLAAPTPTPTPLPAPQPHPSTSHPPAMSSVPVPMSVPFPSPPLFPSSLPSTLPTAHDPGDHPSSTTDILLDHPHHHTSDPHDDEPLDIPHFSKTFSFSDLGALDLPPTGDHEGALHGLHTQGVEDLPRSFSLSDMGAYDMEVLDK